MVWVPVCLHVFAASQTADPIELLLRELTDLSSAGSDQQLSADSEALNESVVVSRPLPALDALVMPLPCVAHGFPVPAVQIHPISGCVEG